MKYCRKESCFQGKFMNRAQLLNPGDTDGKCNCTTRLSIGYARVGLEFMKQHCMCKCFQKKILELIEYVVFHLNHIPCKELIALSVLLKTHTSGGNLACCELSLQSAFRLALLLLAQVSTESLKKQKQCLSDTAASFHQCWWMSHRFMCRLTHRTF